MKRSRFTDEQIAYALRQVDGGTAVADVCRQMGSGGGFNTASAQVSSVSGGQFNAAVGAYSSVSGGYQLTTAVSSGSWTAGTFHFP